MLTGYDVYIHLIYYCYICFVYTYNKLFTLEILIHPQVLGLCALLVIYEYYCTLLKYNGFGNNYTVTIKLSSFAIYYSVHGLKNLWKAYYVTDFSSNCRRLFDI